MDNNLLTEVCVSRIRQNVPELKALALSRKGLRDLDCCYIAQALKTNVFLQKLDLSDNALTDESALFLADMLLQNTALTHLDISGNPMTSAGGGAFIKALQTNASLVRLGCEGGMLGPAAEVCKRDVLLHVLVCGLRVSHRQIQSQSRFAVCRRTR